MGVGVFGSGFAAALSGARVGRLTMIILTDTGVCLLNDWVNGEEQQCS